MNKNIIITIVVLVVLLGGIAFMAKRATAPVAVAPATDIEKKEVCYFKETVGKFEGNTITDDAFTSINYDGGGKVHGIINWIPAEKDSLVGTYTGNIEVNPGMQGYPSRLSIVYAGAGEGIVSYQQQIILVGDGTKNDIKTGSGEMVKDTDGIWKIKDITKLTYDNPLPKVDCASVPDKFRKDYSKPN